MVTHPSYHFVSVHIIKRMVVLLKATTKPIFDQKEFGLFVTGIGMELPCIATDIQAQIMRND